LNRSATLSNAEPEKAQDEKNGLSRGRGALATSQGRLALSESKAAEVLDLSERTLQRLRLEGGGPAFRIAGAKRVIYPVAELEKWLNSRIVRNTGEAAALRKSAKG